MSENTNSTAPAVNESAPLDSDVNTESTENQENLEAEGSEAAEAKPAAPKKEAPVSTKKKYKLKVDNQDYEEEFDSADEESIKKHLQMSKAASKRMQEAAEIRKTALEFIDQLKKNPRKILSDPHLGIDIKKFAEEIINEQLADAEKSPEQREKEKLTRELEELRNKDKQREEDLKKAEFARLQAEQEKSLEAGISAALDVGGLPKTPRTVARMAEMMMIALQNGIDLSPQDIAPLVKDHTVSEFNEILASLPDDKLEDFLGKQVISRLRKKNVAKAKVPESVSSIKSTGTSSKAKEVKEAPKMTIKQFLGT